MKKLPRQAFTVEFKTQAVDRVAAGQSIPVVADELGINDQTLRNWVKASQAGKLAGAGAKVITPTEMELSRLRAELAKAKRENEILKNRPTRLPAALMNRNSRRVHWTARRSVAECFLEV